jgi:hypothetical protein
VSNHTDLWLGSSAQAMKAYTRLLSTSIVTAHARTNVAYSGADFLRRNFRAFQQLDDSQKEGTSLLFEKAPTFLDRNAKDWFKLNATQMLWRVEHTH